MHEFREGLGKGLFSHNPLTTNRDLPVMEYVISAFFPISLSSAETFPIVVFTGSFSVAMNGPKVWEKKAISVNKLFIVTVRKKSTSFKVYSSKYDLESTYGCEAWCVVVHIKNLDIYCSEVHIWNRSLITCHDNKLMYKKGIKSRGVVIIVNTDDDSSDRCLNFYIFSTR